MNRKKDSNILKMYKTSDLVNTFPVSPNFQIAENDVELACNRLIRGISHQCSRNITLSLWGTKRPGLSLNMCPPPLF